MKKYLEAGCVLLAVGTALLILVGLARLAGIQGEVPYLLFFSIFFMGISFILVYYFYEDIKKQDPNQPWFFKGKTKKQTFFTRRTKAGIKKFVLLAAIILLINGLWGIILLTGDGIPLVDPEYRVCEAQILFALATCTFFIFNTYRAKRQWPR